MVCSQAPPKVGANAFSSLFGLPLDTGSIGARIHGKGKRTLLRRERTRRHMRGQKREGRQQDVFGLSSERLCGGVSFAVGNKRPKPRIREQSQPDRPGCATPFVVSYCESDLSVSIHLMSFHAHSCMMCVCPDGSDLQGTRYPLDSFAVS